MNIELISSHEGITPGDQVTFEIQGLEPRTEGGTYVVQWIIEPPGSLTPTGKTIAIDGDHIYSVFNAEEPIGPARATFDVQAVPAAALVDVRYRRGQFPLNEARTAHSAATAKSEAKRSFQATQPAPSGLSGGATDAASPAAAARSAPGAPKVVSMQRAAVSPTASQALWTLIRQSANALSFQNYQAFMDQVLCGYPNGNAPFPPPHDLSIQPGQVSRQLPWRLPFPGVERYRQLKAATEVFVMLNCGVPFDQFMNNAPPDWFLSPTQQWSGTQLDFGAEIEDERRRYNRHVTPGDIQQAWEQLLQQGKAAQAGEPDKVQTILYLALVRTNLPDVHVPPAGLDLSPQASQELEYGAVTCMGILHEKLTNPCFIELLWSYWQQEAGLVQTMNAITWRSRNRRGAGDPDPLASREIDPLRPLNNFLWGYIQDEEHRLSVVRRAYEYAHHYGLTRPGGFGYDQAVHPASPTWRRQAGAVPG